MRSLLFVLCLTACGASAPTTPTDAAVASVPTSHHGAPFTVQQTVPVATVMADPAAFADKTILVEGAVADVCQKAGCWLVLTDGSDHTMRVRMKDHAFDVPRDCAGDTAQIEGVVVAIEADPETAAHLASESANPAAIPEGEGQQTTWEIEASGVQVVRSSKG